MDRFGPHWADKYYIYSMDSHARCTTALRRNLMLPLFVAAALARGRGAATPRHRNPYMTIAIVAVAISVASMLIALAVGLGFRKQIQARTTAPVGNIQLRNLDGNHSFEQKPIDRDTVLEDQLDTLSGLQSYFAFALKPGIIKQAHTMQGCVLKGVDRLPADNPMAPYLVRGRMPNLNTRAASDELLISEALAQLLQVDTADKITIYFVQQPPRVRRFTITGIYCTRIPDFDKRFLFADLRHVVQLNGWTPGQIGGYQLHLFAPGATDRALLQVEQLVGQRLMSHDALLQVVDIRREYAVIFDWLDLIDTNVYVLLTLMLAVACVNMITVLLILILERTRMIGLFKALGCSDWQLRRVFILHASRIMLWGLVWGNLVACTLLGSQARWRWVRLDPADYYIDYVPVALPWALWVALNLGAFTIALAVLTIPSSLLARIQPAKALK